MDSEILSAPDGRPLIAELVSHHGAVEAKPVAKAFDELATAVRSVRSSHPYGAVITSEISPIEPATVWRTYLNARDQVADFAVYLSVMGQDLLTSLKSQERHNDISIISTSAESNPYEYALNFAKYRNVSKILVDDVFLLLSGEELSQMTKHASRVADEMLLLLHVSKEAGNVRSRPARLASQPLSKDGDDDASMDGPTLSWRQSFLKDVRSWSAEEVAQQGGHQAKNTSAAAWRLAKDGKIFAVSFGGKLRYPKFQFKQGRPRKIVARILQALGNSSTDWDRAFFFAEPNVYLDETRPMDRLDDQAMEERLVQLADRHAHPADVF
jgi:hypothetical protein